MRKALTLIVAATLLVTCTACSNDGAGGDKPRSQCTGTGNGIYVCEVPRPNGATVECMKVVNGGMSCDWNY